MAKRTTHRSKSGKKLYAKRDAKGKFKDIQSYQRAHGTDIKRKSKQEAAKKSKSASKSKARKKPKARKK
jgi:hypothetical protein